MVVIKINFNESLKDLKGEILKDKEKDLTLKDVSANALLGNYQDEKIDGEEKLKRFLLATKIYESKDELELTIDEIKMTKDLIARGYSTLVTGRALQILDPHKK